MLNDLFRRVIGSPATRLIKKMQPAVVRINELEPKYRALALPYPQGLLDRDLVVGVQDRLDRPVDRGRPGQLDGRGGIRHLLHEDENLHGRNDYPCRKAHMQTECGRETMLEWEDKT